MGDLHDDLSRLRDRQEPLQGALERLVARRRSQHLRRRVGAGVIAVAIAGASFAGLTRAFDGHGTTPAASSHPSPRESAGGITLLATSFGPTGDQVGISGRLGSTGGCLSLGGEILLWPRGYGLVESAGAIWVVDSTGAYVAKVGDPLPLGGYATDLPGANRIVPGGVPAACVAAQAQTPDPYWRVGEVPKFWRFFFSASGVRGVLEVSSSPPSICYATQSFPARPISIIAEPPHAVSHTEVSYDPNNDSFCDRTARPGFVTDLLGHPSAYRVRWRPHPDAPTVDSSLTAEPTPPLAARS